MRFCSIWQTSVCFFLFIFFSNVVVYGQAKQKEEIKQLLGFTDEKGAYTRLERLVTENPGILREILLGKEPEESYSRLCGISFWGILAAKEVIPMKEFFDLLAKLLSEIDLNEPHHKREPFRRDLIYLLSAFGMRPLGKSPIYFGFQSSLKFFHLCVDSLNEAGLIFNRKTYESLQEKIEGIKSSPEKDLDTNREKTATRINFLLLWLDSQHDQVSPDCMNVLKQFSKNLLRQVKSPTRE